MTKLLKSDTYDQVIVQNVVMYFSETHCTRLAKKVTAYEKFYISVIVKDIFTKFARLTGENSLHICKFYYNSTGGSIGTTV